MVKRATIHVSSRTKMNHPKKWRVRIITKDKKGNEKKTTNTTFTIFYNQVTLAGKAVIILSWRSCCFSCLPCRRIVYTRSVFCPREALLLVVKVVLVVFPTQQAVSRNFVREVVVPSCKSCLSYFPYSAGCIETTRYNVCIPPFEDKKLYSYE